MEPRKLSPPFPESTRRRSGATTVTGEFCRTCCGSWSAGSATRRRASLLTAAFRTTGTSAGRESLNPLQVETEALIPFRNHSVASTDRELSQRNPRGMLRNLWISLGQGVVTGAPDD